MCLQILKVLRIVTDRQMDGISIAYKNKVIYILKLTCFSDVLNLSERLWSRMLGITNILVVEIKQTNVVLKKQQLLGTLL